MDSREKTPDFWERRARLYGRICVDSITMFETDPEIIEQRVSFERGHIAPKLRITPRTHVLDLGCGPGRWTSYLAPRCERVVAVDFSPSMIEAARRQLPAEHLHKVEFVVQSSADFLRPEQFDLILILGVLIYLDDEQCERTIRNASLMLAPGGQLISKESIGLEWRYELRDKYSEVIQENYTATYRSEEELRALFASSGLKVAHDEFVYPEGSKARKFKETAPKLFILEKMPVAVAPGEQLCDPESSLAAAQSSIV